MRIQRDDGFLKIMIIVFPLIVLGNTIEYFFVTKNNLKKITGKVSEVVVKTYECPGRGLSRMGSKAICEKTIIRLENVSGSFHVSDYADQGAYIDGIKKGDEVTVYIRYWYQYILTFGAGKDIYGLEKDGVSYYDIDRWKRSNLSFIIIFGAFTLFFVPLYILQRKTINELIKGKDV